jgi:hypothetical protein
VRIAFFKDEQWDPSVAIRARQLLLDIVKRYARADQDISPTNVDVGAGSNSSTITTQNTIFAIAMALKAPSTLPKVTTAIDGKGEVDLYCGNISPVAPDFDDPLKWWKVSVFFPFFPLFPGYGIESFWQENSGTLKYMGYIVRDILAIPGVSISVEHLFSSLKHTLSDAQSSMTAETASVDIATKEWLKSGVNYTDFIKIHKK